jgi:hypothetical protein
MQNFNLGALLSFCGGGGGGGNAVTGGRELFFELSLPKAPGSMFLGWNQFRFSFRKIRS